MVAHVEAKAGTPLTAGILSIGTPEPLVSPLAGAIRHEYRMVHDTKDVKRNMHRGRLTGRPPVVGMDLAALR